MNVDIKKMAKDAAALEAEGSHSSGKSSVYKISVESSVRNGNWNLQW
jgi:hypothetical protein